MPIYEYRCDSCGFQKEHLQKMSDPQLTTCPDATPQTRTRGASACACSATARSNASLVTV